MRSGAAAGRRRHAIAIFRALRRRIDRVEQRRRPGGSKRNEAVGIAARRQHLASNRIAPPQRLAVVVRCHAKADFEPGAHRIAQDTRAVGLGVGRHRPAQLVHADCGRDVVGREQHAFEFGDRLARRCIDDRDPCIEKLAFQALEGRTGRVVDLGPAERLQMHQALRPHRRRQRRTAGKSRVTVMPACDERDALRREPHVGKGSRHRPDMVETRREGMHAPDVQRAPTGLETVIGVERGRANQ